MSGKFRAFFILCILLAGSGCITTPTLAEASSTWRYENVDRIVVIPDVHGAYSAFTRLLIANEVVDDSLNWAGGKTHLVSLGDLLDRGAESRKVMDLLIQLQKQSKSVGGRVHVVAGNHELMNLVGDLRYVAVQEFAAFATDETAAMRDAGFVTFKKNAISTFDSEAAAREAFERQSPAGYFAHREAFSAGGYYGQWLLSLPAVVVINDTAFVHGGLPTIVAESSLEDLNRRYREDVTDYLQLWRELIDAGLLPDDQSKSAGLLAQSVLQDAQVSGCLTERVQACERPQLNDLDTQKKLEDFAALSDSPMLNDQGPLWYRGAAYCRALYERPLLDASLANLGVRYAVAGHTTTPDAKVHALHDNKMTLLDTGMLVKYYNGRPASLIIENQERQVRYLDPDEISAPLQDAFPIAYRMSRDALGELMKSGDITITDATDKSAWQATVSHKGQSVRAVFIPQARNQWSDYALAAHALDNMLGMELVPPTAARSVNGTEGAVQLLYADAISENQRVAQGINFTGWCPVNRQIQLMHAWDLLIANRGRSTDNIIYQKTRWRVQLTEHGNAFGNDRRLPKGVNAKTFVVSPEVKSVLKLLNDDNLTENLGQWLDKKAIRAILSRRDALLKFGS